MNMLQLVDVRAFGKRRIQTGCSDNVFIFRHLAIKGLLVSAQRRLEQWQAPASSVLRGICGLRIPAMLTSYSNDMTGLTGGLAHAKELQLWANSV
jgi:hypothetical protein